MPPQRRRKKHRGTQAGTVRQRGRGARSGSRAQARQSAQDRRIERMNRPPNWRGAIQRAGIAAAVFLAVLILVLRQSAVSSVSIAMFMFLVYIPMGYAMDSFIYRLRQRRKAKDREE